MPPTSAQTRRSDTHEDILKRFDEEIGQLEAKLISLKLTRNGFAPISRLHPEILQEIFLCAHYSSSRKGKASLTISLVCHRWRELSHDISSLWSWIDFINEDWVKTALSRTKNRELKFDFAGIQWGLGDWPTPSLSLVRLCLQHISRTSNFHLNARPESVLEIALIMAPEWTIPAPLLEGLSLEHLTLPRNPFSGIYPRLQSLSLWHCTIDWDTLPVISGLKELEIISPTPRASPERIAQLLDVVQYNLERLALRMAIGRSIAPHNHAFQRPHLTRLAGVEIVEEHPNTITSILKYISFPRQTRINLCPFRTQSQWEGSTEMVSQLVASRNMETWPVHCVHVDAQGELFTLKVQESRDSKIGDGLVMDRCTEHGVQLDFGFQGNLRVIPIFNLLPIHPITRISFNNWDCQITGLLTYIGDLGTVQELIINSNSMVTFLNFVQERSTKLGVEVLDKEDLDETSTKTAAGISLSFLNLQRLSISGSNVEEEYSGTWEELLPLRDWLKWRMAYGFPLKSVELRDVVRSELIRIQELLLEVVYDGVEVNGVRVAVIPSVQ